MKLLDTLIDSCSKPLPRATHKTPGVNDLDFKIGDTRECELVSFVKCTSLPVTSSGNDYTQTYL